MSLETELKFRVAKRKLGSLTKARVAGARVGKAESRNLTSTYFDTPKQKLQRHGLTLRVRQTGDEYVQTVKATATGSASRSEWEAKIQQPTPVFHHIGRTPLAPLATKKTRRQLEPVFKTSVHRTTRPIDIGPSEIELAVDRGNLLARQRSEPIAEFELELKKGRIADLFHIAKTFERRTGAELDLRSKAERGFQLANGKKQLTVHAEPIALTKTMTPSEAFNIIAYSTLRHFTANADGIRELDAEAIHQMRVGLRRLRAAISLFGDILPGASTAKIKAELKWLTNQLAPAREIDVFVKERIRPLERAAEPKRGIRAIEGDFAVQRKRAFQDARDALATARYRTLLIEVLEWLETPRRSTEAAETSVGKFVSDLMRRRIRKATKAGRHLNDLSALDRHKLRIKIKKIRYGLAFFRSLYSQKDQKDLDRLSNRLKKIQDALGALNDFVAHRDMAAKTALNAPRKDRRARAFASGLVVGQEREASKTLLKAAFEQIQHLRPLNVRPA
jgi:triphosphatase